MAIGPMKDVVGELKTAFTEKHPELHFGLYYSLFEWYNPIYLKDKQNQFQTRFVLDRQITFNEIKYSGFLVRILSVYFGTFFRTSENMQCTRCIQK